MKITEDKQGTYLEITETEALTLCAQLANGLKTLKVTRTAHGVPSSAIRNDGKRDYPTCFSVIIVSDVWESK